MCQRYQQSSCHQEESQSTSLNPLSYVSTGPTPSPLSDPHPTGLGLSFYTTGMAMPQTQSPGPMHRLSYFQRPIWGPSSNLMLDTNPGAVGMERGKSWEEAYDPFAQFPVTGPSVSDQYLLSTPMSQSESHHRLSDTPSHIAMHSIPPSHAGSLSSASYPPSESIFPQSDVKLEDPLDWTSNSHTEFPAPRSPIEPDFFVQPESVHNPHRMLRSPVSAEPQFTTYTPLTLGKHRRENSIPDRLPSHLTSEEKRRLGYKRKRTPREHANWTCEICDMPFERSYNLKSHLETHDPDRQKPFKCEYEGCVREFVRKTDLTRHIHSVRPWMMFMLLLLTPSRFMSSPRIGYARFVSKLSLVRTR